eukprot:1046647-Pelagomonas_calceolata.AAC.2
MEQYREEQRGLCARATQNGRKWSACTHKACMHRPVRMVLHREDQHGPCARATYMTCQNSTACLQKNHGAPGTCLSMPLNLTCPGSLQAHHRCQAACPPRPHHAPRTHRNCALTAPMSTAHAGVVGTHMMGMHVCMRGEGSERGF